MSRAGRRGGACEREANEEAKVDERELTRQRRRESRHRRARARAVKTARDRGHWREMPARYAAAARAPPERGREGWPGRAGNFCDPPSLDSEEGERGVACAILSPRAPLPHAAIHNVGPGTAADRSHVGASGGEWRRPGGARQEDGDGDETRGAAADPPPPQKKKRGGRRRHVPCGRCGRWS